MARQREIFDHKRLLATAGNLVFYNAGDRWLKAVHAESGKELWRFQAGSPSIGNPISYHSKVKQYMALMTGIGIFPNVSCFEHIERACHFVDHGIDAGYEAPWLNYAYGGMLHVFSL